MRQPPSFAMQARVQLLICFIAFFSALAAVPSSAQTIDVLAGFDYNDGQAPQAALVQGSDGNFYGTADQNGANGWGTVFKVTPDGVLTVLHSFNLNDGAFPQTALVHASDGNFYGSTPQGGTSSDGTIFKITPSGAFTVLYNFTGGDDGLAPGQLIQASDGNLYGTALGGRSNCFGYGCGVIFKITLQGAFTKVHQFSVFDNGYNPAWLMQASDGNFYGMTAGGGDRTCGDCGTIFKLSPQGVLTTLHGFGGRDGKNPQGQLVQAGDGNFYGTTQSGGAYGYGTVFQITPSGSLSPLHSFCAQYGCPDGNNPYMGLTLTRDGTLYGTTPGGGLSGCFYCGTIFNITTDGRLTTLYTFYSQSSGGSPVRLLQATNGNLYGLTSYGGIYPNYGTFYRFYPTGKTLSVSVTGFGTVTSSDGIINCAGMCTHIYPNDTQVTLNATPRDNWAFTGWGGACSGTGSCTLDMNQDRAVSASFLQYYTLTVATNGSGSVTSADGFINCPGVCSHVYVQYTPITLTATPGLGWSFNHWDGPCISNYVICEFELRTDETATATFWQNSYRLTASVSGQGTITSTDGFINCPGACSHVYLSLTPVTLNANPAQGWSLNGWSGSCLGTGPCNLNMTSDSAASAYFNQPGQGFQFVPLMTCRLVDTRQDHDPIQGGTSRSFRLPDLGGCGIPTSAAAYSLNVTVAPPGPLGYLTIWPTGLAQPVISTMNSVDGRVKANAAIVPPGNNQSVSVYVTNTTDLIVDTNGYFTTPATDTLQFYPLAPCRVADTRDGNLPSGLGPPNFIDNETRELPILTSTCLAGINNAKAYSMNVTVAPAAGAPVRYLTIWPSDQRRTVVSTLNDNTGTVVANAAIVPAAANGDVSVFVTNATDVILDINGYFAPPGQGGYSFYPAAPCRAYDSRNNGGQPFQGERTVNVVGSPCEPPSSSQAFVFNGTVVPAHGPMGYLTLWPDGQDQPVVSTLNARDGFITSNMAIVPNSNGSIDAYASGLTQLLLDISGYFAP